MTTHCCEMMRYNVENGCKLHRDRFDCPDCLIHQSENGGKYGIIIHDGGRSFIGIQFCPWCGVLLPTPVDADTSELV